MHAFLTSHPDISIPAVGSNMWTYFYDRYGDLDRPANLARCLDDMFRYKHVLFLQPDRARIEREFAQGEPTYARLFSLFLIHAAERDGKPRWGAQTGLIERYADLLFEAYPDLKVVHMIRDPRDRYQASIEKWPNGKGRAGGAVARWNYSRALAERHQANRPADYMIVRFEDLVTETEATMRAVCAFLGIELTESMLAMTGAPTHRGRVMAEAEGRVQLSSDYIGRYRSRVEPGELLYIQTHAAEGMARYGYQPDPITLSAGERVRYHLVTSPSQSLRRLAWRTVEEGQQRLPRLVPRKPGRRMIMEPDRG